jgi:hypothetical protein
VLRGCRRWFAMLLTLTWLESMMLPSRVEQNGLWFASNTCHTHSYLQLSKTGEPLCYLPSLVSGRDILTRNTVSCLLLLKIEARTIMVISSHSRSRNVPQYLIRIYQLPQPTRNTDLFRPCRQVTLLPKCALPIQVFEHSKGSFEIYRFDFHVARYKSRLSSVGQTSSRD